MGRLSDPCRMCDTEMPALPGLARLLGVEGSELTTEQYEAFRDAALEEANDAHTD